MYKRSDKQIQTVQKRYNDAVNWESITTDSIQIWFSEDYLNTNPEVFDFFYNLLEKKNNQNFLPAYKIFVKSDKYHINYNNFNIPNLIMTG